MKIQSQLNFIIAAFVALATTVSAQQEITIPKQVLGGPGTTPPIRVCLSGFTGEVEHVLNFDLYVMGFINVSRDSAQFIIAGSNHGNVQGRVLNPLNQAILSRAYSGASLRRQAHAFANDIVKTITGVNGIALTKIAFKVDEGRNGEIYLADFDGHDPQAVTHDNALVAAPTWVPGRMALYYTSYKLDNPDIFYQNLTTGQRTVFAHYPGLNTSAAVSPDGHRVAMILSKSGSPDVYVCNADGSGLKDLTPTPVDESSPCWSPDGKWICFATKSRRRRILRKVSASGGPELSVSTSGVSSPSEPSWSPDGKWIAFTAQMGNFEICVVPADGGLATVLVDGEDPSWAPNSRTLIYTRRVGASRRLSLLDVPTKQVKDIARVRSGNNSQPSWAR